MKTLTRLSLFFSIIAALALPAVAADSQEDILSRMSKRKAKPKPTPRGPGRPPRKGGRSDWRATVRAPQSWRDELALFAEERKMLHDGEPNVSAALFEVLGRWVIRRRKARGA